MSWSIWLSAAPTSDLLRAAEAAAERLAARGAPPAVLTITEVHRALVPWPHDDDSEGSLLDRSLLDRLTVFVVSALAEAGVPTIVIGAASAEVRELVASRLQYVSLLEGADADVSARITAIAAGWPSAGHRRAATWVIWVTGRPGSGKTTIVRGAVDALARRGIATHVVSLDAVRAVAGDRTHRPDADDPMHRALAYAAKRLCEAGVPVIVDATAPRRAWREYARGLIARFAEVQLVCPAHLCATRERAVRWGIGGGPPQAHAPDIVLDYELSLRPDATIHTDVEDPWTAAESLALLAVRLQEAAVDAAERTPSPAR